MLNFHRHASQLHLCIAHQQGMFIIAGAQLAQSARSPDEGHQAGPAAARVPPSHTTLGQVRIAGSKAHGEVYIRMVLSATESL